MHRLATVLAFCLSIGTCTALSGAPVHLRCEYRENPIGIDIAAPHLSWQSDNSERNWVQTAYRILVASNPDLLRRDTADVWDSGRQESAESIGIAYGGPKLVSGRRYYWTVRVWDSNGTAAEPAEPAYWETGLLAPGDWSAKWISRDDREGEADRKGIRWIWSADQNPFAAPPETVATFRMDVEVAGKPRNVALYLIARAPFRARVNGHDVGGKDGRFREFDRQDVTEFLVNGRNRIEVTVTIPHPEPPFDVSAFDPPTSGGKKPGTTAAAAPPPPPPPAAAPVPAAFAALFKVTAQDGAIERFPTNDRWQVKLGSGDWKPAAVVAELNDRRLGPDPGPLPAQASLFRREFVIARKVTAARFYITALGSSRAFVNGRRVGDDVLTPEYTDYKKRVTYQDYDVTGDLRAGKNVLGVVLGYGWFGSGNSWLGVPFAFLPPPTRLLAQLRVDYADGTHDVIASDGEWKTAPAPILHSEIYAGEIYDARLEQPGWDKTGFDDSSWQRSKLADAPPVTISAEVTEPVRVVETLQPKSITPGPNGTYVFDMGQNMVGWVRLKVAGPAGTKVRLRFAEILNPDGTLYVQNLRNANQTDAFYLRGAGEEVFEPHFTFHGFRYVEVSGYPGVPTLGAAEGRVVSSVQRMTGKLTTSSDLVNRMWRTGIWGQRGNFLSIPTDCPQRDERMGWTGDAQVFWRTGSYNADIAAFGHKWMRDVTDAQTGEGSFTNTAPDLPPGNEFISYGAPGWGDAGVIVPWTAWQQYGDLEIVRENWQAMQRWMKFIAEANPDFLRRKKTGANFADWLPAGSRTPRDLVATAYWAMIARMMSQMAAAIHEPESEKQYSATYESVRQAFQKEFISSDGVVGSGSQTSYVLALNMNLVPDPMKQKAIESLVKDIQQHDWHLTTGFLGTPPLLFVLANNGHADVAYRLLLNTTYPSWGYMLGHGATTWWERWNSDSGDPAMNSFNHYAFGSVMAFVYREVAGIDTAADGPGFRHILVHPRINEALSSAGGEYDSVYGRIVTDWRGSSVGPFELRLTVPANTRATVYLPAIANAKVMESGKEVSATKESDSWVVEVGSGSYVFEVK
jgi:alpha-L-rhamnosidase